MRRLRWLLVAIAIALALLPVVALATDIVLVVYPIVKPTVVSNPATDITHTSGNLQGEITGTGNNNPSVRGFEWGFSTGNYTSSWNETGSFGEGVFNYTVSNLTLNTTVYYITFATNTAGRTNSTEESFTTLTLPLAPTDFVVTMLSSSSISITWTPGSGANITVIRASITSYPADPTEGDSFYSGNGTSVVVSNLTLDLYRYYIRAWSHNEFGYSIDYAQARVGGEGGLGMSLGMFLGVIALGVTGLSFWRRNIVLAVGSALAWLVLGVLVVTAPDLIGITDLSDNWVQILTFLFFAMAIGCFLWYISGIGKVKITQTDKGGKSWSEYGKTPKEAKPTRSSIVKTERLEKLRRLRK